MTVPWRLGVWRWAWPRVLAVALCLLGLLFQPANAMDLPAGNVVRLSQATRSEAGSLRPAYPPADSHSDTLSADLAVALPDNWDSTRTGMHNQAAAYAWYTLRFTAPSEWQSRSLGAYLPAVGMNAELFLNGQRIGSFGHMEEPVTRHFYTPLLFQLPAAMLRPSSEMNLLQVLVVGYPQHRNGLSEVFVGEMAALRPAWLWRGFWQNTGTLISSVLTIMLGLGLLMNVSIRRPHLAPLQSGQAVFVR